MWHLEVILHRSHQLLKMEIELLPWNRPLKDHTCGLISLYSLSMISGCRYQVFDFLYQPDLHIKTCWPNTTHQICRQQYHKERQHVPLDNGNNIHKFALDNGNNIHKFPLDNGNNIHTFHKHLPEFVHTALIELLTTIVLNLKWHI